MDHSEFIDWIIKGILAASFAGWALVIRYFGGKYITSLEEIQKELVEIKTDIAVMKAVYAHNEKKAVTEEMAKQ